MCQWQRGDLLGTTHFPPPTSPSCPSSPLLPPLRGWGHPPPGLCARGHFAHPVPSSARGTSELPPWRPASQVSPLSPPGRDAGCSSGLTGLGRFMGRDERVPACGSMGMCTSEGNKGFTAPGAPPVAVPALAGDLGALLSPRMDPL